MRAKPGESLYFAKYPLAGDYWHEMFCPIAQVEAVSDDSVVCWVGPYKPCPDDPKRVYLPNLRCWTREEFVKYVTYDSEDMKHKTWCDCIRKEK